MAKQVLVLDEDTSNIRNINGHFINMIHLIEELNAVEFPTRTCARFLNMLTAYSIRLFPALEQVGAAVRCFTRISSSITLIRGGSGEFVIAEVILFFYPTYRNMLSKLMKLLTLLQNTLDIWQSSTCISGSRQ